MKERFELIPKGDDSYLVRYVKEHWWSNWKKEMDGDKVKKYPVDQRNCVHRMKRKCVAQTVYGSMVTIYYCEKCGKEQAGRDHIQGWKYEEEE